ncbi:hypothetical protein [Acinetobacter ihumii]|uniref:hypothetical protein n=1 Tax=Acinetobacter ihumii TaxID=2483802 RepID=UPI00102F92C9|nr:hypothetical protein [Acinetobacter ihumii]
MTVSRSVWQNIQHYGWLVCGLICLLFALIFWAMASSDQVKQVEKQDIAETQTQIQPQKVTATANLGTLSDEVKPLDLTMRVITTGNHEAEFRGTKFIQENQRNWTIELFRSSDENIVKNYLKGQTDRQNFLYFRLSGENQEEQFVLSYGVFSNESQAKSQLAKLNLNLPASVHPQASTFSNYVPLVNDLGMDEIKGVGTGQLYSVVLRNAPIPVVSVPTPSVNTPDQTVATTSTTVTQRDEHGNVIDIHRQVNSVESTPKPSASVNPDNKPVRNTEREISDPFN